jgi:hydroxymethylpyrimidine/phosphomethylpyrimidine kinase
MSNAPMPAVLVFAGTDPTGGAGLQADILTLASLGCHPLSVVTAITVQDTVGVEDYLPMDADWINDQARSVLEDMPVAAIKIGMIGSVEGVAVIAEIIADYPDIPVVLDPVLTSGRGDPFANEELIDALRDLLLPQVKIITPNSLEARRLVENSADDDADEEEGDGERNTPATENAFDDPPEALDLDQCASSLIDMGCEYVLITGAHEQTVHVSNTLYNMRGILRRMNWERLPASYHGSGCTLASAIAAFLAQGQDVSAAVKEAQEYTYQSLKNAYRPGMGQFIPDRLYWVRGDDDEPSAASEQ